MAIRAAARHQEACRHARRHEVHVGLGDLGAHGHHIQLRQHDDGGRALKGVQCLALSGDHRHHGAVHRRDDACVVELRASRVDLRSRLHDLGLQRVDLGSQRIHRRLGRLQVGLRGRLGHGQRLLPAQRRLGLRHRNAPCVELRAQRVGGSLGAAQRDLLRLCIHLGDQLALGHALTQAHVQALHAAGHLCADGDQFLGADAAHRLYVLGQGAAFHHRCGQIGSRTRIRFHKHDRGQGGKHDGTERECPFPSCLQCIAFKLGFMTPCRVAWSGHPSGNEGAVPSKGPEGILLKAHRERTDARSRSDRAPLQPGAPCKRLHAN